MVMPRTFAETHRRTIDPHPIGRTAENGDLVALIIATKRKLRKAE